jgi:hypothetical protein
VETGPDPENQLRCWFEDHQGKMEAAAEHQTKGWDAFQSGSNSRAMMHLEKSNNRYSDLDDSAQQTSIEDEELNRLLESYTDSLNQASAAAYSAVYEIQVNEDRAAADLMLNRFEQHTQDAADARSQLKDELGVAESTELTEVSGDCGVF